MNTTTQFSNAPNIVFLLADDQSYWSTRFNGHPAAQTPNLDALAAEGIIFDRHYVTSPICMASRASIATGLYEYRTGCNFEHGRMSPEMFTTSYHMQLKQHGYYVGYAGKFGFGVDYGGDWPRVDYYHTQDNLPGHEFDWWRGLPGQGSYVTAENEDLAYLSDEYPHLTRALGAASAEFFDQAMESDRPFCLTVGFKAPHDPPTPDPIFDDVYSTTKFPKPGNYGEPGAAHLPKQVKTGRQWEFFRNWEGARFDPRYRTYFQLIHGVDFAVGMIREALEERGLSENTVIIYSSDNGYFCGSHRMGGKVLMYEEASRVPLIIYDPRRNLGIGSATSGMIIGELSGNIDICPTILSLAGLKKSNEIDGVDLTPILDNFFFRVRESLNITNFWNMPPTQGMAVTDGRYKYIYHWYQGEGMQPAEELYDLEADPLEMQNLIADPAHSEQATFLRVMYDAAVKDLGERNHADRRYEHYGVLLNRSLPWTEKESAYQKFFERWITTVGSWRGGTWFEDLDLSVYPEEVTWNYGRKPE